MVGQVEDLGENLEAHALQREGSGNAHVGLPERIAAPGIAPGEGPVGGGERVPVVLAPVVMLNGRPVRAVSMPARRRANGRSTAEFGRQAMTRIVDAGTAVAGVVALVLREEPEILGIALGARERVGHVVRIAIRVLAPDRGLQSLVPGVPPRLVRRDRREVRIGSAAGSDRSDRVVEIVTGQQMPAACPDAIQGHTVLDPSSR